MLENPALIAGFSSHPAERSEAGLFTADYLVWGNMKDLGVLVEALTKGEKQIVLHFENSMGLKCTPNTLESYKNDVTQFLLALRETGYSKAKELKPMMIDAVLLHMMKKYSLGRSSIARKYSAIYSFVEWAVRNDYAEYNFMAFVDRPKPEKKLPEYLTEDEISRFMNSIDLKNKYGMRDRAMFELLYGSGIRASELENLTHYNLDLVERKIKVNGKGMKDRYIPLPDGTADWLTSYLEQKKKGLFPKNNESIEIFLNFYGEPIGRRGVLKLAKGYGMKASINKNMGLHIFRHSYATHLVRNGANLFAVQRLLGHESITNTTIYVHLALDDVRSVVDRCHPRGKDFLDQQKGQGVGKIYHRDSEIPQLHP